VPDLPGHAFTDRPAGDGLSLPGMAQSVGQLLQQLQWPVNAFIGHSAGAAIAAIALGTLVGWSIFRTIDSRTPWAKAISNEH
jgi:pimeloyl-ACP methyl ester carboxylesterase